MRGGDDLLEKRSFFEMSAFARWTGSDAYAVAFAYCVFILKTIWGHSATLAKTSRLRRDFSS